MTNYRRIAAIILSLALAAGITAATTETAFGVNGVRHPVTAKANVNGV